MQNGSWYEFLLGFHRFHSKYNCKFRPSNRHPVVIIINTVNSKSKIYGPVLVGSNLSVFQSVKEMPLCDC